MPATAQMTTMIRSSLHPRTFAIVTAIITIGISSCAPVYFSPPASTPLFTNAGEVQMAGAISTAGGGGEIACSPMQHLGVIELQSGASAGLSGNRGFDWLPMMMSLGFRLFLWKAKE
ncbi:MAG: hypothetical protein JWQ98_1783 [Chlorobi bacterium]|nr:hypothetical protein [Chlorobiota bacterium]